MKKCDTKYDIYEVTQCQYISEKIMRCVDYETLCNYVIRAKNKPMIMIRETGISKKGIPDPKTNKQTNEIQTNTLRVKKKTKQCYSTSKNKNPLPSR